MNKGIILRASLILGTFLIIILVAVGCEMFDGGSAEAQISNPDGVFMTVDGEDVTNQELWEVMKNVDGLDYLIEYAQEMLLATYIDALSQEEIDAEIRLLTYLTEDEEIIAEIMANPEVHQDYLDAFRQNVEVLGYDSEDPASLRQFVELALAKRAYVKAQIELANPTENLFVEEEMIKEYYDNTRFGDACSLDIRFQNTLEADAVFSHFGLVPNYKNGIGEYIGTEDMDTLAKGDFNDTNTIVMSETAVWASYVEIYNYMNPWETAIPTDITPAQYCIDYADAAVKSYEDLVKYKNENDPNVMFADYVYNDLDLTDEDLINYTYTTNKVFGDYIMLVFKVSQEDVTAFDALSLDELQEVKDELYEVSMTDEAITFTINALLEDSEFEIYDPLFKLKYEFQNGITFDNNGSETDVATLNGVAITADELFNYMVERIGAFYSLEVAKSKLLINSDAYTAIYGESHDYLGSKADKMVEHRDSLREMKSIFSSNGYASYGYSSATMTWDEFIYLAFGVEGEEKLIETMFVVSELQFDFMFDEITYESGVAYMQDKVDNYFSLGTSHILIFIDFDKDFAPDDFSDFTDGLDATELTEYNAIKLNFENLLAAKFNDDYSLQDIVDEYTESLMGDTTSEWYEFKNYGFFIMTEQLGEIDHLTVGGLDDEFGVALKRIYDAYSRPENKEESSWIDDQVVVTDFGIHLIEAIPGSNFEMKTAEFEFTTENSGDYTDGSEGTTVIPNKAQVEIYLDIQKQVNAGENPDKILPSNVNAAIEYYYGPIYSAYMSQTGFSIAVGNDLLAGNISFTANDAAFKAELQNLIDVFYEVNFPELFDADAQ